jgi:hypothetical protein
MTNNSLVARFHDQIELSVRYALQRNHVELDPHERLNNYSL